MTLWIGLHKYLLLVGKILSQHQKQQKNMFVKFVNVALRTSYSNSSAFLQSHVKLQFVFRQGRGAPCRADL